MNKNALTPGGIPAREMRRVVLKEKHPRTRWPVEAVLKIAQSRFNACTVQRAAKIRRERGFRESLLQKLTETAVGDERTELITAGRNSR